MYKEDLALNNLQRLICHKTETNKEYQSKVIGRPQNFLFLILKVLFLMKQVKHNNGLLIYFGSLSFRIQMDHMMLPKERQIDKVQYLFQWDRCDKIFLFMEVPVV